MMPVDQRHDTSEQGWFTRERLLILTLIAGTLLLIYICYLITRPFLPALAWALALAVVTHRINDFIQSRMKKRGLAAGIAVAIVVIGVLTPVVFVSQQLVRQASDSIQKLQEKAASGRWRSAIERNPRLAPLLHYVEEHVNVPQEAANAVRQVTSRASTFLTSSIWALMQLLITILTLFYFFRDQPYVLRGIRSMVPLSERETDRMFNRIGDTIYATVFGSITVAAIQGTMGGLMFWWLGLPAPVLWGAVMTVLSVIPVLGSFVVWIPAAIFLLLEGSVGKALILVAWGGIAIALIDNLLYPWLVGHRLAVHPLPVFFSIVGGIMLFGAAGLILGPLALAVLLAVVDVWKRRTIAGQPAEEALQKS